MNSEIDFDPRHGIASELPPGERVLWQGAPRWWGLATDVFHVRAVALYFAAIAAWRLVNSTMAGEGLAASAAGLLQIAGLGTIAVAILLAIAKGYARTTFYSITTHRVVIRSGVALQVAFNLPLSRITGVALQARTDGNGDIALTLDGSAHIAYAHLWPNARPWRLARPEPALRCLADGKLVADILVGALARHRSVESQAIADVVVPPKVAPRRDRPQAVPPHKPDRSGDLGVGVGATQVGA